MAFSFSEMAMRSPHALLLPAGDLEDVSQLMKRSTRSGYFNAVLRAVAPPRETPITAAAFLTLNASNKAMISEARTSTVIGVVPQAEERPRVW